MTGLSDYERHTEVAKALLKNTAVDNQTEDYTRALLANAHATLALAAATREAATPQRLVFDPTSHVPAGGETFTPVEFDKPACLCQHYRGTHQNGQGECKARLCRCEQYRPDDVVCIDCQGTGSWFLIETNKSSTSGSQKFYECETCRGTGYIND